MASAKEGGNHHASSQAFPLVAEAKQQQQQQQQHEDDDGGPRATTGSKAQGRGGGRKVSKVIEVECGSPVSPGTDSEDHQPHLHHQQQQEPHDQNEHAVPNKDLAWMATSMTSSLSSTNNLSAFLDSEAGGISNDDELYSACEQGDVPAVSYKGKGMEWWLLSLLRLCAPILQLDLELSMRCFLLNVQRNTAHPATLISCFLLDTTLSVPLFPIYLPSFS